MLVYGMGAYFHKSKLATLYHHLIQQFIQADGIRSRMSGRNDLSGNLVFNRANQTAFITEAGK
jgi:hypothetical protein